MRKIIFKKFKRHGSTQQIRTESNAALAHEAHNNITEPEFVNVWSPEIDSKKSIPPAYVAWRAVESIPGLLKRLQILALDAAHSLIGTKHMYKSVIF
jgi:hypothetical protein